MQTLNLRMNFTPHAMAGALVAFAICLALEARTAGGEPPSGMREQEFIHAEEYLRLFAIDPGQTDAFIAAFVPYAAQRHALWKEECELESVLREADRSGPVPKDIAANYLAEAARIEREKERIISGFVTAASKSVSLDRVALVVLAERVKYRHLTASRCHIATGG